MKRKIFLNLVTLILPLSAQEFFVRAVDGPHPNFLAPLSSASSKTISKIEIVSGAFNQSIIWGLVDRPFDDTSIVSLKGDLPDFMKLPSLESNKDKVKNNSFEIVVYYFNLKKLGETGKIKPQFTKAVSEAIAIRLQNLWVRLIKETRYPTNAYRGVDGSLYIFGAFYHGYGDIFGEIWSPDKGNTKIMADLLLELEKYAANDIDDKSVYLDKYLKEVTSKLKSN